MHRWSIGEVVGALLPKVGPPFYDEDPGARLARAVRCAIDIRAMTNKLPERIAPVKNVAEPLEFRALV